MRGFAFSTISLCALAVSGVAQAQAHGLSGFYAGPEIGAVDHHFVVEEDVSGAASRRFNVTQWGVGAGLVVGYMTPISDRLLAGVEAGVYVGGKAAAEQKAGYTVGIDPKWGYSATARLGYAASDTVMLFTEAGYGGHRYDAIASGPVANDLGSTDSFVLGAGVEYALSRKAGLRLRFQHLDGTRNQIMLGLPIRF